MNILYTGAFRFPDKDAAGKRVANIINAIEDSSDIEEIYVAGWEQGDKTEKNIGKVKHSSFSILDNLKGRFISKLLSFAFQGTSVFLWFIKNNKKYQTVMLYNPPAFFAMLFLFYSKIKGFKLILDSTEWYESSHLKGGRFGFAAFENYVRMRIVYPRFKNIIAISEYLENYYRQKKIKEIIRVPPLAINFEYKEKVNSGKLELLYAGSPGKKDRVDEVISKFLNTSDVILNKCRLHIVGLTLEKFLENWPAFLKHEKEIKKHIVFYGRIPMANVIDLYRRINYCIFIRDNKRYALAGFPSKFVESLSMDTPVITNNVGDVSCYIKKVGLPLDLSSDNFNEILDEASEKKYSFSESIKVVFDEDFFSKSYAKKIMDFIR